MTDNTDNVSQRRFSMLYTRVGRRGQIVLPKEVRMRIQVAEGDQIAFIFDGERVVIKPITHTLLDMRGRVRVSGKQDFDTIRRQAKTKRARIRGSKDEH
jgi:AbrB family looped-hinge helix DNA binding protein